MQQPKEQALQEARNVVDQLVSQTPLGRTFQNESFVGCLAEEIEATWKEGNPKALINFQMQENGTLAFVGVGTTLVESPTDIYLDATLKEDVVTLKDVSPEQTDVFALLASMKENYHRERSKILENLDQISANFDKLLIETIKNTQKPSTAKIAEEYLHLDIQTKKAKLLEKLLEGKKE